jgi:hypothetical protein
MWLKALFLEAARWEPVPRRPFDSSTMATDPPQRRIALHVDLEGQARSLAAPILRIDPPLAD